MTFGVGAPDEQFRWFSQTQRIPKNFLNEEGLHAELISADWSFQALKENLAFGKIDATLGLDMKLTAILHKGCIHVMTARSDPDTAARITRLVR